jgi:hypothetical protein
MLQYIKSKNILTLHIIYAVLVKSFKCYSPFSFSTVIGVANLCYFQNVSKYEDAIRILKSLMEMVRDNRWDIIILMYGPRRVIMIRINFRLWVMVG